MAEEQDEIVILDAVTKMTRVLVKLPLTLRARALKALDHIVMPPVDQEPNDARAFLAVMAEYMRIYLSKATGMQIPQVSSPGLPPTFPGQASYGPTDQHGQLFASAYRGPDGKMRLRLIGSGEVLRFPDVDVEALLKRSQEEIAPPSEDDKDDDDKGGGTGGGTPTH